MISKMNNTTIKAKPAPYPPAAVISITSFIKVYISYSGKKKSAIDTYPNYPDSQIKSADRCTKLFVHFGSIIGRGRSTNLGDNGSRAQKQLKSTMIHSCVLISEYTSSQNSIGQPSISTGSSNERTAQQ